MLSKSSAYATIGVKDLEKAVEFYEGKLGLEPSKMDNEDHDGKFYDCGNTKIFVYTSKFGGTNQATSATWVVEDINTEIKELSDKGIEFEHYDFPGVKREGDVHIINSIRAAWFKDPDGNILNIMNH